MLTESGRVKLGVHPAVLKLGLVSILTELSFKLSSTGRGRGPEITPVHAIAPIVSATRRPAQGSIVYASFADGLSEQRDTSLIAISLRR